MGCPFFGCLAFLYIFLFLLVPVGAWISLSFPDWGSLWLPRCYLILDSLPKKLCTPRSPLHLPFSLLFCLRRKCRRFQPVCPTLAHLAVDMPCWGHIFPVRICGTPDGFSCNLVNSIGRLKDLIRLLLCKGLRTFYPVFFWDGLSWYSLSRAIPSHLVPVWLFYVSYWPI